jgi:hypothetical protein
MAGHSFTYVYLLRSEIDPSRSTWDKPATFASASLITTWEKRNTPRSSARGGSRPTLRFPIATKRWPLNDISSPLPESLSPTNASGQTRSRAPRAKNVLRSLGVEGPRSYRPESTSGRTAPSPILLLTAAALPRGRGRVSRTGGAVCRTRVRRGGDGCGGRRA